MISGEKWRAQSASRRRTCQRSQRPHFQADQADDFRLINPTKRNLRESEKARKPAFRLINPAATPVMEALQTRTAPRPGHFTKEAAISNRRIGSDASRQMIKSLGLAELLVPLRHRQSVVLPAKRPLSSLCHLPGEFGWQEFGALLDRLAAVEAPCRSLRRVHIADSGRFSGSGAATGSAPDDRPDRHCTDEDLARCLRRNA